MAAFDFKEEGLGQDDNPFDRETERDNHDRYAWQMHRLWSNDLHNQVAADKAIEKQQRKEQRERGRATARKLGLG